MTLLTRLSLANRAIVALLSFLIVAVGLWATASIKQELMPSVEQPAAVVVVSQPGASSATLDEQVVAPLAKALKSVPGVEEVVSNTSQASAQLQVTWPFGGDSDKIVADVRAATTATLAAGPANVTSDVWTGSTSDIPVVVLALTSDADAATLAERVDASLVPVLKNVSGVRDVQVSGRIQERVQVTLDPVKLAAKDIDAQTVSALLRASGTVVPAGMSVSGDEALSIEVGVENTSLEDVAATRIPTLAGPVALSEVASVELVPVEQSSLSRADGRESIGLSIMKDPDANAVQVSHAVSDALRSTLPSLGDHARKHVVFDQSTMVEQSIHDLSVEGGLGLVFAVLVILVFLMSPRATVITAVSIPMSLLIAVAALQFGGFSLNIFTLAALTVAVGRVVDDSIVVIENIARRRGADGLTTGDVLASVRQVAGAVTASTLTTVAVFLPVAFVGGMAGELFRPFAVTVSVALLASLLVSLTIVPVLAYWFMRRPAKPSRRAVTAAQRAADDAAEAAESADAAEPQAALQADETPEAERTTRMQRWYLPSLRFALRRPATMILIAVMVFVGTVFAAGFLKTDMLGSFADARAVSVTQTMPRTATLPFADAAAKQLEGAVSDVAGVESTQTTVGMLGADVRLDLVLAEDADPDAALERIRRAVDALPEADEITVATQATQTTGDTIDTVLTGSDETALAQAATQLQTALGKVKSVKEVKTDLAADQPVLRVTVDRDAAALQGFTSAEVGAAIAAAVQGDQLGSVTVDGRAHDLLVRARATDTDPASIAALPLPVTALQQQRTQKQAADELTKEQEAMTEQARAEAEQASDDQVAELRRSRSESADALAELRSQLEAMSAAPVAPVDPKADPPVTASTLTAIERDKAVAQLQGAIAQTEAGLDAMDEQITKAQDAIADGAQQQAEADALAARQRALEKLRAEPVTVGSVAKVEVVKAPATITRIDGVRAVTVSAVPAGDDLGAAAFAVDEAVAAERLPAGITLATGGAGAEQAESFGQLALAMVIAIALVYILLVATFRSLVQPLLLLASVPLAATGAILGLLVTGTPLGIPAMIGMLMLIGIVVTNAIVLIDLVNDYRREGAGIDEAVTHGARLRLRPIVMTAAATVFALVPMALGFTGGGAFISQSLAIVVIGGLLSSTLLTLLVVPSLYVLHERRILRRADRRAQKRASRAAESEDPLAPFREVTGVEPDAAVASDGRGTL